MMKPAWALNKNLKLHSNVEVVSFAAVIRVVTQTNVEGVLKKNSLLTLIQWKPMYNGNLCSP